MDLSVNPFRSLPLAIFNPVEWAKNLGSRFSETVNGVISPVIEVIQNVVSSIFGFVKAIYCTIVEIFYNPFSILLNLLDFLLDFLISLLPSTPEEMQLANLQQSASDAVPFFGPLVPEVLQGFLGVLAIVVSIKLVKLIPFL